MPLTWSTFIRTYEQHKVNNHATKFDHINNVNTEPYANSIADGHVHISAQ
jgi:hypothetical protein